MADERAQPTADGWWPTEDYRLNKNIRGEITLERLWIKAEWPHEQHEKGEEQIHSEWRQVI